MSVIHMPDQDNLVGHLLSLGTANKFTCIGFMLSRPFNVVTAVDERADQVALKTALADGRLIDVTGHSSKQGLDLKKLGGALGKTDESDTRLKIFTTIDEQGRRVIILPKDENEQKAFELELATTGKIKPRSGETSISMTAVTEVSVEPFAPPTPQIIIVSS